MFLADLNQCPSEWLSTVQETTTEQQYKTVYKFKVTPPLTQYICYCITGWPTFINSSATLSSWAAIFPKKSKDDRLPCFLYKSFFYG